MTLVIIIETFEQKQPIRMHSYFVKAAFYSNNKQNHGSFCGQPQGEGEQERERSKFKKVIDYIFLKNFF